MAKLHVSECFVANSLDAVRLFGASGYVTETGIERDLRDSVGGVIFSGTNDIQRQHHRGPAAALTARPRPARRLPIAPPALPTASRRQARADGPAPSGIASRRSRPVTAGIEAGSARSASSCAI